MASRRPLASPRASLGLTLALALGLAACTPAAPGPEPTPTRTTPPPPEPLLTSQVTLPEDDTTVLAGADATTRSIEASRAFFEAAPVVVLAPGDDLEARLAASSAALHLGVPVLISATPAADADGTADAAGATEASETADAEAVEAGPGPEVLAEIDRLDPLAVLAIGPTDLDVPDADLPPVVHADGVEDLERLLGTPLDVVAVPAGGETTILGTVEPGTLLVAEPAEAGDGEAGEPDTPSAEAEPEAEVTDPGAEQEPAPEPTPSRTLPDELGLPTWDTPTAEPDAAELPRTDRPEPTVGGLVLTTGDGADLAALATARAAGAEVLHLSHTDPRATSGTVQAVSEAIAATSEETRLVALGPQWGDAADLGWKVATAATGVELPGGGQVLFPGRRLIAMYGTPTHSGLGILGEQGVEESVARARSLAAEYEPLTDDVVVPAFEIIVTIASAGAGDDGNYSNELAAESFIPWVEAAREAGVYVVLDLQPGRTDFLTQAQQYEELLREPHVGLALDPEWRLEPDQVHLRQIGAVDAAEVNEVITWLADLTRDNALPQKLLILHQFRLSMITNRDQVDLSREELSVMVHADGQGSQPAKQDTWRALRAGAPEGLTWGWKNFIDEDTPMLTPQQTFEQVDPVPHFVSYQ